MVPEHKRVPSTRFVVDCFNAPCPPDSVFFLTHGHWDHHRGLSETWTAGPVYCTTVTAAFITLKLGVRPEHIRELRLDEPFTLDGVRVVAVDANHCPGAVQLLFCLPDGRRFVHSGDCRYTDAWQQNAHLQAFRDAGVEALFLDTTFCHPRHDFPQQSAAIRYAALTAAQSLREEPQTLILLSAYTIGKERLMLGIAREAGVSVGVSDDKMAALACLDLGDDLSLFTTDVASSPVRVLAWDSLGETFPFFKPNWTAIEQARVEAGARRVLAFVPTGWNWSKSAAEQAASDPSAPFKVVREGVAEIHLIPYSEHSSFSELQSYVRWLRPRCVIPTVNADTEKERAALVKHFRNLVDENSAKRAFIAAVKTAAAAEASPGADAEPVAAVDEAEQTPCQAPAVAAPADASVEELLQFIGADALSVVAATALLRRCGGDIAVAVNAHLDAAQPAKAVPAPGGAKRKRSGGGEAKDARQRSVASFFTPSPKASPASQAEQLQLSQPSQSDAPPRASAPQPQPAPQPAASAASVAAAIGDAVSTAVDCFDPQRLPLCQPSASPVPYLFLAATMEAVLRSKGRIHISNCLVNAFRTLAAQSPSDVLPALFLLTGTIAAPWEAATLNLGGSAVASALCEATGATRRQISDLYPTCGDLGDVAAQLHSQQRLLFPFPPLTVKGVHAALRRIAAEAGTGAGAARVQACAALLRAARGPESRFLVRTLLCNLRLGASRLSVLHSLAVAVLHERCRASGGPPPDKASSAQAGAALARAHALCPSFEALVPLLLQHGPEALAEHCCLVPGVPALPMLAKAVSLDAVVSAVCSGENGDAYLAERKYDGTRCQCHILPAPSDDPGAVQEVRLFYRSGDECTAAYPDAVAGLRAAAAGHAGGAILDAELVAVQRAEGGGEQRIRPFQELSTRRRTAEALPDKARPASADAAVPVDVCLFFFDALWLDGASLVSLPLRERRAAIHAALPALASTRGCELASGEEIAPHADDETSRDAVKQQLMELMLSSVAIGCEGLMIKQLGSPYEADKRSSAWLKLKKDTSGESSMLDSVDLVPIGAWRGQGRKHAFFSPFLMAAYDRESQTWTSICRVLSGISDEVYRQQFNLYTGAMEGSTSRILPQKPSYYETRDQPEFWFEPSAVWELRGADFTLSPVHTCAMGVSEEEPGRGISLRFPRLLRIRDDKSAEEATTPEEIAEMFLAQHRANRQKQLADGEEGAQDAAAAEPEEAESDDEEGEDDANED
jgi:DNA ligase-1